jgi:hypothetical protein
LATGENPQLSFSETDFGNHRPSCRYCASFTVTVVLITFLQKVKKLCAVVFIVLAVPSSSGLARTVSLLINCIIVMAVLSYILSTERTLR